MITNMKTKYLTLALLLLSLNQAAFADGAGKLFPSAEEAAASLAQAVQTKDKAALVLILGPSAKELVDSGDDVAQGRNFEEFSRAFSEHHLIQSKDKNLSVLTVGKNNWPFPIPLREQKGRWYFDTKAGGEELLNRRIGENEVNAIDVCRAYVTAQTEYVVADAAGTGIAQFATKVVSTPGQKDGLFWPVKEGEQASPFGPLIAEATSEGYSDKQAGPEAYHGYFFRILKAQGPAARGGKKSYIKDGKMVDGFALIAYPAKWGKSGIMTFIVNHDGKVYEKNLGANTESLAEKVSEYNPDRTWKLVRDQSL